MLNKKHIILLLTLTILLIGVASATEVSNDTTSTDTQKTLTGTTNDMDNNIETSINTEKTLKKISTEENNKKTDTDTDTYTTTVSNYNELVNKVNEAKTSGYKTYTINLTPGDYNATDSLTWGDSISTDTLAINGNGITLNGQNKYQFMKILEDHSLSLNNITITNYTSGWGGAIYINHGNLILDHVIFKNNVVLYGDGGAILNSYSIITIFNSDFIQNQVKTDLGFGGAISNWWGTITIYNSNFNQNSLESEGGVVTGGAIDNNYGTITVINTNFTENTAETNGGAIHNDDDLTLINCTFTKNTAGTGGAIYNGEGTLNISNCTFSNNVAEEHGGDIYIRNDLYDDISVNPIIISSYFNNNLPFELLENNQKYNIKLYDDIVSSDNVDIYLDNAYDGNYRISDNLIEWNKKLTIGEHEINIEAHDNNIITFNVNVNSSGNQGKSIDKNTKNNSETKESSDNNNKTDNQTSSDDTNQSKTDNKNSEPLPYFVIKKDQTYSKFDNNLKHLNTETTQYNILTLKTGFNVTLSWLNNLFKQDFANREILIYIDGILVYNSTTSDNLSDILFTILEEYKGEHTLKVVTDENVYTKRVNII